MFFIAHAWMEDMIPERHERRCHLVAKEHSIGLYVACEK